MVFYFVYLFFICFPKVKALEEFQDFNFSFLERENNSLETLLTFKNIEEDISLYNLLKFSLTDACENGKNYTTVLYDNYIKINVSRRNIVVFDKFALYDCKDVVIDFYAHGNYLQEVPEYFFVRTPVIRHIDLSNNNISKNLNTF